ncbi:MAG TPA: hypothetical protein VF412_14785 [Bdellovibrio sp.]|uniref:hypothetical protein n=1 Tax=Bdellovibrio sp. TaxID=28201 RepID=UPI002EFE4117
MANKGRGQKSSRNKAPNSKPSKKASEANASSKNNKKKSNKKKSSGSKKSQTEIASLFAKISKVAPFGATILNSTGAFAGSDGGY